MSEEITTANAEAETNSVDSNTNISVQDLANRRLGQMNPEPEAQEEVQEEVQQEEVEEVQEEETQEESEGTEETTEEPSEDNVLSQLDLDDMSEDELRELADKLGSRAVARYGELTAKRKAAEEQLAKLQNQIKENPLETKKVQNNPYSDLDSVSKLQAKAQEVENIVEWAEDILFESDSYAADDVVTELDGKDWTKKEVRHTLLQARKAQKTFLPDQLKRVQAQEAGEQLASSYKDRAETELTWLSGEDNDLRKQYEATVGDDRFQRLKSLAKKEMPDVAAQLDYWFAHATNSIYGRKPVQEKKSSPQLNPPKSTASSSAQSERGTPKAAKAIKELSSKFKKSGNFRDFAELRRMQISSKS